MNTCMHITTALPCKYVSERESRGESMAREALWREKHAGEAGGAEALQRGSERREGGSRPEETCLFIHEDRRGHRTDGLTLSRRSTSSAGCVRVLEAPARVSDNRCLGCSVPTRAPVSDNGRGVCLGCGGLPRAPVVVVCLAARRRDLYFVSVLWCVGVGG